MKSIQAVILAPGAWIAAGGICHVLSRLDGEPTTFVSHVAFAALLFAWMWRVCND